MAQRNEAWDPFWQEDNAIVESDGRRVHVIPLTFAETMRIFNERLMKTQEDQNQINASILDIPTDIFQRV